jgi:DNA polymerase delta subunit 2
LDHSQETGQFRLQDRCYSQQYAGFYFSRLSLQRPRIEKAAQKKWKEDGTGGPLFVPRLLDIEEGKWVYVVGTVFFEMPLKPNVLQEITQLVTQTSLDGIAWHPKSAF